MTAANIPNLRVDGSLSIRSPPRRVRPDDHELGPGPLSPWGRVRQETFSDIITGAGWSVAPDGRSSRPPRREANACERRSAGRTRARPLCYAGPAIDGSPCRDV